MTISVKEAIIELKKCKPIIIFDKLNENEGDVVFPSENINIEMLNFMLNNCKGVICQTLTEDIIQKLEIPIFKKHGENKTGQTNFVYPVDHINSETGISSNDRMMIIKELISDNASNKNFVIPGHQNLLKISKNGLQTRQGHTESSSYIVKQAGFKESAVICEIIDNKGVPMRYDSIIEFSQKHNIKVVLLSHIHKHFLNKINISPSLKTYKNPYNILNNKNVVITGGSSGIGSSLKNKLLEFSCNVIDLSRRHGLDITNFEHMSDYVTNYVNNVDMFIHCAGFIEPESIKDTSLEKWNNHVNVNLTSCFLLTKLLIPKFNNKGVILNITSPSAKKTRENWSAYCCTKAALNSFTLNCANELKDNNICVNGISPTKTNTPMIKRLFPTIEDEKLIDPNIISNFMINILCDSYENNLTGQIFDVTTN
jgi:3,4-dihydroxy-2-butanone 4-phosphate synthase